MKKKKILLILSFVVIFALVGCTEADMASYNLSLEADNFNIVRRLTVINCIDSDVILQMEGKISIEEDNIDNQLEITVENDDGTYCKHFVSLGTHITYVVEDLNVGANNIEKYKYTINFNPKMWLPVNVDVVD
ncbi:MAG: hypothetical protein E7257_01695 [Lachnospiraceae bacterium]|nr:hypothetical protein [Lachnospiraceae bacterium]